MFTLSIKTDNEAFEGDPGYEVARILRRLADRVECGEDGEIILVDINGNRVGMADFNAEDE